MGIPLEEVHRHGGTDVDHRGRDDNEKESTEETPVALFERDQPMKLFADCPDARSVSASTDDTNPSARKPLSLPFNRAARET
jgi:hypothetical protein